METRLSPWEHQVLQRFASEVRLRLSGRVDRLSLFGSRARGEGTTDSDLDLLVLVKDMQRGERLQIIDIAHDISTDSGLNLSPVVHDSRTWREDTTLAVNIRRDGVSL